MLNATRICSRRLVTPRIASPRFASGRSICVQPTRIIGTLPRESPWLKLNIGAVLTAGVASSSMAFKKPILCEAIQEPTILPQRKSPLVNQTELTFGTVLGLCAGFLTKKLGKLAAGLIGTGFLFLQYMASKGYVNVNWKKLDRHYRQSLDTDRDGKVTGRDISSHWDNFSKLLTHNFQFKSTFLVGFAIGFRYG